MPPWSYLHNIVLWAVHVDCKCCGLATTRPLVRLKVLGKYVDCNAKLVFFSLYMRGLA